MKIKTLYSLLVATLVLTSVGCKKEHDHVCECEFRDGKPAPTTYYNDISKEQAENQCAAMEQSMNQYATDSSLVVTCSLR